MVIGPTLGMAVFALSPAALWIGCGGLGILAAVIISMRVDAKRPSLEAMPELAERR